MLSFSFDLQKLKSTELANRKSHNLREGKEGSYSQLDPRLWFSKEGRKTIVGWDSSRLELAKKLSKRKDAVHAFSIFLQVGNQDDWRFENGQQKTLDERPAPFELMEKAAKKWAEATFGKENIVSIEAHYDESSPHFHIIATPIHNNKLQAKHWFQKGLIDLREMRKNACSAFNEIGVACGYTVSRAGGRPHDSNKATGSGQSTQLADLIEENERHKKELQEALAVEAEQDDQLQAQARLIQKQHTHSRWVESELEKSKTQTSLITKKLNNAEAKIIELENKVVLLQNENEELKAAATNSDELENKVILLQNENTELKDTVTKLNQKSSKPIAYKGETITDDEMRCLFSILQKGHPSDGNCHGDYEESVIKWDNAIKTLSNLTQECKAELNETYMWKIRGAFDDIFTSGDSQVAIAKALDSQPMQLQQAKQQQKTRTEGTESTQEASKPSWP